MLKIKIDRKIYPNGYQALGQIMLDIPTKGLYAIVGESGSGKSTLLNCISGIDNFDGELFYNNKLIKSKKEVEKYRKNVVSTIFQDFRLLDDLSVVDNVILASDIIGKKPDRQDIEKLFALVGLPSHYRSKKISELSFGEMQRVAIARAIAKDARIIVADEPTANLDSENANNIITVLKNIAKDRLVLVVTHNTRLVDEYCAGYIEMEDGVAVKNTLPSCIDAESEDVPDAGKTSFSLIRKLIQSQRKNNIKNIANIVVTIIFLLFSALGIIFTQVTFENAMRYTLDSNSKGDRTIYANFEDKNGYAIQLHSDSLDEETVFCDLGKNAYYPQDIFTIAEYSTYLKKLDEKHIYYGNILMTVTRAIFTDSLDGTGLISVIGKTELESNEIIIPSAVADVMLVIGKTTQAFEREKNINKYEDLLDCEFSIPKLNDGKVVKIAGIYQSPTKYFESFGDYKKMKKQNDYDNMAADILTNNSVVLSKANLNAQIDGIVLDYSKLKNDCLKDAKLFKSKHKVNLRYKFAGSSGISTSVQNIENAKDLIIIPLTVLFNALAVLTIYIAFSGLISRNSQNILTLRALGMSSRSIAKMYLLCAIMSVAIESVAQVLLTLVCIPILNLVISAFNTQYTFTLLRISVLSVAIPILVLLASTLFVVFLSISKLFRKSVETQVKEA